MKLSRFKYNLQEKLIALYPTENRDESRLLVLNKKTGKIEHTIFKNIIKYFNNQDVMVFNDTKVFPARLYGNKEKTGALIEVFLIRELNTNNRLWDVLVDPARKIRIGNKLYFGEDNSLVAEVIDNTTSRGRTLRFLYDGPYDNFKKRLFELGEPPLPPTIKRKPELLDADRYQTIYAKHEGAVVAPTAGLHFSREVLKRLEIKGIKFADITLHAGLGNFRKVDVEDLSKHKIDLEQTVIGSQTVHTINSAIEEKQKICAVGTTVVRALEGAVTTTGHLTEFKGWVNKFIFPPHQFHIPTHMITNFHMPYSLPLIMAATFGGLDPVLEAYNIAMKEKYRFGTYGDAMLIINR